MFLYFICCLISSRNIAFLLFPSHDSEREEILVKDFDNYQDAKDHFEEIKNETQQGGDIVTDLQKIVYGENDEIDWSLSDMDLETFCNPYNYEEHYGKLVIMYMHTGKQYYSQQKKS